ncbi:lipoate--protein ligase [Spiroplasma endosymbiont of Othius punctulatus]|uniref:lipoate--protein ligase n=1 Tax=Spiroplasma endosymbiont of Othius punctulatus TaxID=3066289 RepID=UPI0030CD6E8F
MKLLVSKNTNAKYNLAVEEFLTYEYGFSEPILFIWQNDNSIIIGRNQNTFAEVNIDEATKDNVVIVRRNTGGGTVFHDLGNICYSYIDFASNIGIGFKFVLLPIIEYLNSLGLSAEFAGRNDLQINGKKISGNAQLRANSKILQHGTLLFNSEIKKISNYLNVNQEKLKHQKVMSAKHRVTNIDTELKTLGVNLQLEDFKNGLLDSFYKNNKIQHIEFSKEELKAIELIQKEKFESEKWTFEKNSTFQISESKYIESVGFVQINFNIENQIITEIKIYGDFLSTKNLNNLYVRILGKKYDRQIINEVLNKIDLTAFFGPHITSNVLLDVLFNNREK